MSHRLILARAARDAGCDATVVTRVRDHGLRRVMGRQSRRLIEEHFDQILVVHQTLRVFKGILNTHLNGES